MVLLLGPCALRFWRLLILLGSVQLLLLLLPARGRLVMVLVVGVLVVAVRVGMHLPVWAGRRCGCDSLIGRWLRTGADGRLKLDLWQPQHRRLGLLLLKVLLVLVLA